MEKPFKKVWKTIANKSNSLDKLHLCFLRAFFARESNVISRREILRSQIANSFTPITNMKKIINGREEFYCIRKPLVQYSIMPVDMLLDHKIFGLSKKEAEEQIFGSIEVQKEFWKFVQENAIFSLKDDLNSFHKRFYSYIFVDQVVSPINQAVQIGHVAMCIGQNMKKTIDAYNVYFQVCELTLPILEMFVFLKNEGFDVEAFFEPVYKRFVAIGTHPVRSDKRRFLVNYNLLKFDK